MVHICSHLEQRSLRGRTQLFEHRLFIVIHPCGMNLVADVRVLLFFRTFGVRHSLAHPSAVALTLDSNDVVSPLCYNSVCSFCIIFPRSSFPISEGSPARGFISVGLFTRLHNPSVANARVLFHFMHNWLWSLSSGAPQSWCQYFSSYHHRRSPASKLSKCWKGSMFGQ